MTAPLQTLSTIAGVQNEAVAGIPVAFPDHEEGDSSAWDLKYTYLQIYMASRFVCGCMYVCIYVCAFADGTGDRAFKG